MDIRIKQLWIDALRSGKYTQSRYVLKTVSGYCCLGVLCDLAEKENIGTWGKVEDRWVFVPTITPGMARSDILPAPVLEWAGLTYDDANPETSKGSLASNNDHGATFLDIAELIEREL